MHGRRGPTSAGGSWRSWGGALLELGQADTRPAVTIAVVEHVPDAVVIEHPGILDALCVPPGRRHVDPRKLVATVPGDAVHGLGVSDAVAGSASGEPHAVPI